MAIALLVRSPQHEDQMSCTGVGVLTPNGLSLMKVQIVLSNSPAARLTATGTEVGTRRGSKKKVPVMKDNKKFGKRGSRTHYIKFAIVRATVAAVVGYHTRGLKVKVWDAVQYHIIS